ncbi:MAG TPA: S41 family peptidase [Pseudonocardiaceae bacterium]
MGHQDWSACLDTLCAQVIEYYVFPDVGEQVAAVLRERQAAGAYDAITDDEAFAAAVTEDLQSVNGDKHLRLLHSVDPIPEHEDERIHDPDAYRVEAELENGGIAAVRRLDGNVGYLDLRSLHDASVAGGSVVAAMTLVAHTDALIIDLRRNGGGDPHTVAMYCSYLFDDDVHLNDIYLRPTDATQHFWTMPWLPGPRFGGTKPVHVLTSAYTFSGAEELAYNLRTRERATLIGERTRGGANPGGRYRVAAHLKSAVPSGRAINPVTGTNWEGVGVEPHVEVPAAQAYDVAYRRALEHVLTLDDTGPRRPLAAEAREALAAL